jgi:hypothetical protein
VKRIRIFVASPGDVPEERDIVTLVVDELRRIISGIRNVELESVRWETHAWPDVGEDAQDVINREIGEFDIFVGVMWKRFGTPTKRADSGTREEFERAYDLFTRFGRPRIMFYFKTAPFYSTDTAELTQFGRLVRFRKKLEKAGVLFWQYERPLQFERAVREHLIRQLLDVTKRTATPAQTEKKKHPRKKSRGPSIEVAAPSDLPEPEVQVEPQKPLVFMSAAREDSERVLPVYHALADAGFKPWLDMQDLLPGQMWQESIRRAILDSDVFVVFLSHASVTKRGYVHKELRFALEHLEELPPDQLFVIPVRLDPVAPFGPIAHLHWIDLFGPEGIEKLIETVRHSVESPRRVKS